MPRAGGPFEVLERVNDNAYKIDLPRDCKISATFNVSDLSMYEDDDSLSNFRSNFSKDGEDDGGPLTTSQDVQNGVLDRAHHGLAMVEGIHPWEALDWNRVKPGFVHLIC